MYWVSVNERLPQVGLKVITWQEPLMRIACYYAICPLCGQEQHFAAKSWCADLYSLSHWMHLPHPPAPKEGKCLRYERKKRPYNKAFGSLK